MCTNCKWVLNPYSRRSILVPCGKCPACQMEKANKRTERIRNNHNEGDIALFLTLTYQNKFLPYVKYEDIGVLDNLPIYRDFDVRRVRVGSNYEMEYKCFPVSDPIGYIDASELGYYFDKSTIRCATGKPNCVSVSYYKDLQNFINRLNTNLSRRFGLPKISSYYACSEYGPTTWRAHLHVLVWVPFENFEMYRDAIVASWPFDCGVSKEQNCQVAKDADSYVSSYVNRPSDFPALLALNEIRPRHSYSQGFGMANPNFKLPAILDKLNKNEITYKRKMVKNGVPTTVDLPIPKYVISRFFPLFKGYSRLGCREIFSLLRCPSRFKVFKDKLNLTDDNLHVIFVSLRNHCNKFKKITGLSSYDFAIYYEKAWRLRNQYILSYQYRNPDRLPVTELYDNIPDIYALPNKYKYLDLKRIIEQGNFPVYASPNFMPSRIDVSVKYADLFNEKLKTRKLTNFFMSDIGKINV